MAVSIAAFPQFLDSNGKPLSGGLVWSYAAGTTTPLTTYTSREGNIANSNPVVLDADGRASIWLSANVAYKLILEAAPIFPATHGVEQDTIDNYYAGADPDQLQAAGIVPATGGSYTGLVNFNGGANFGGTPAQNLSTLDSLGVSSAQTANLWINSDFANNQRVAASVADGAYGFDRTVNLAQTGSSALSQLQQPEDGTPYAMRITQPDATAKRVGFCQIVEANNCLAYRGKNLVLTARLRCSAATTVRVALVAWAGTSDSPPRDLVADWASANFTAGNFFVASTLTIAQLATPLIADTWTNVLVSSASAGGVVAPSTMNNLYMVAWTDSIVAQNVTLDASRMSCGQGTKAQLWTPPDAQSELAKCQRYWSKSYQASVAPGTNTGVAGGIEDGPGLGVVFTNLIGRVLFPVPARVPAPAVQVYDAAGLAGFVTLFNPTQNNAQPPTGVDDLSERGFKVFSSAASPQRMCFHWTMNAEVGV